MQLLNKKLNSHTHTTLLTYIILQNRINFIEIWFIQKFSQIKRYEFVFNVLYWFKHRGHSKNKSYSRVDSSVDVADELSDEVAVVELDDDGEFVDDSPASFD